MTWTIDIKIILKVLYHFWLMNINSVYTKTKFLCLGKVLTPSLCNRRCRNPTMHSGQDLIWSLHIAVKLWTFAYPTTICTCILMTKKVLSPKWNTLPPLLVFFWLQAQNCLIGLCYVQHFTHQDLILRRTPKYCFDKHNSDVGNCPANSSSR